MSAKRTEATVLVVDDEAEVRAFELYKCRR